MDTGKRISAKSISAEVTGIIGSLLERGLMDGVMALKKSGKGYAYSLLTKGAEMTDVDPLAPYLPTSAANIAAKLSRKGTPKKKIALFVRPCEMRAIVELIKLLQVDEALYFVELDCPGTLPSKYLTEHSIPGSDEFLNSLDKYRDSIRPACSACTDARTDQSDVAIRFLGTGGQLYILGKSEKGSELVKNLFPDAENIEEPVLPDDIVKSRKQEEEKLFQFFDKNVGGLDNLLNTFANCMNCHNCMRVCPICFCRECFFDSTALDFEGEHFVELAARRGDMHLPTDTLLFHIGRMNHMAISCVGCGFCEDACPVEIPLLTVFKRISRDVQALFDYSAGSSRLDEHPLKTFREEELEPR
ncbi:MAG: hypothetical protein B6D65_04235 [candidate division Zixibacteria bacterium 4484_93]|nr:MAG: hypothetical protein B6D65_04235 [candidate division Zixibacteria bacterium 4484_93]